MDTILLVMRHTLTRTPLLIIRCKACSSHKTAALFTSRNDWQRKQAQPFLLFLSFLSLAFFFLWLLLAASEDSYSTE